jgi:hypothetical protein
MAFLEAPESGGAQKPLVMADTMATARRCQEQYWKAATPAQTVTLDVKMVSVADGRVRWTYRDTMSDDLGQKLHVRRSWLATPEQGSNELLPVSAAAVGVGLGLVLMPVIIPADTPGEAQTFKTLQTIGGVTIGAGVAGFIASLLIPRPLPAPDGVLCYGPSSRSAALRRCPRRPLGPPSPSPNRRRCAAAATSRRGAERHRRQRRDDSGDAPPRARTRRRHRAPSEEARPRREHHQRPPGREAEDGEGAQRRRQASPRVGHEGERPTQDEEGADEPAGALGEERPQAPLPQRRARQPRYRAFLRRGRDFRPHWNRRGRRLARFALAGVKAQRVARSVIHPLARPVVRFPEQPPYLLERAAAELFR